MEKIIIYTYTHLLTIQLGKNTIYIDLYYYMLIPNGKAFINL